jgi:predicted PurR-regulated permease PerM
MRLPVRRIDNTITLAVLALLVAGCVFVLMPFLTAIVWAAILCATAWPLFEYLRTVCHERRAIAALVTVLLIALAVLAPFIVVGVTLADNAALMAAWWQGVIADGPPDPPEWVARIPLVGANIAAVWTEYAHDTASVFAELRQYMEPARRFALGWGGAILNGVLQLALSMFIAFFFLRDGDVIIERLEVASHRIAGERGAQLALLAASTVRGVVLGILGTALAQGVLAAIGFYVAGIKAAPLLGFLTFLLSPVPIGPPLVWGPAALWLIYQGHTGWGLFLLGWGTLVVSTVDNVIKPLIISRGSDLPFVLVLLGVLGGAIAFGFIGVFLGPVLLAVGYTLLREWAATRPRVIVNDDEVI